MLENIQSTQVSEFDLYSQIFKTKHRSMADHSENSVNFDSLNEEIDSLGHYNSTVDMDTTNENNATDSFNVSLSLSEPKEPPDKTDLGSLLGSSSDPQPTESESEDQNFLLFGEDAQSKHNDSQTSSGSVASLSSPFEENVKTIMEQYTEKALKSFQTKDKLQLKLEEELNALTQDHPAELASYLEPKAAQTHQPEQLIVPLPETEPEPLETLPTFPPFEDKMETEPVISEIQKFCDEDQEFVSFTLTSEDKEKEKVDAEIEIDPHKIVGEILDDLIPGPFNVFQVIEEILDCVIEDVSLLSFPPSEASHSLPVPLEQPPMPVSRPPPFVPLPSKKVRGKIYPPTFPPITRPGRLTNRLEFIRKKVVPFMFNHKEAWPFKTPVDAIKLNIPDYHTIVKSPMDLGTIKKRLLNRYYWDAQECQDDFKMIFRNCYIYNKPEYDIVKMCKDLERAYDEKIETMSQYKELDVELEKEFTVQKGFKRKKKLVPGEVPPRKRTPNNYYKHMWDFEDEIPISQVHMPHHLLKVNKKLKKRGEAEESSSGSSDEETEDSESEEEGMLHRSYPSHLKTYTTPQPLPVTSATATGKASEKKQKHLCRYCEQPFLSRTVRDMHEKAKHITPGSLGPSYTPEASPQPVIKKVPPLKVNLKKVNSLQIVPVKQENEHNGPHNSSSSGIQSLDPLTGEMTQSFPPAPTSAQKFPSQPLTDADMMNFVDKKHKAMLKKGQQNRGNYYR